MERQSRSNLISPDDRVFFWQVGQEARLLAVGHVTSPVFERESPFGRYAVGIAFDSKILPPLTKQEALENKKLREFRPFSGAQGTNFVIDDPAITSELDAVLKGRLIPLLPQPTPQASQQDIHSAIKRTNREVANSLKEYIAKEMEPAVFELLIGALLLKLGYTNVEVTKKTGDGGVDVRALLVAGGVASTQTCVQVKRQKSVGRPIVQSLRGSLSAHETGLLITSGVFTEGASEEAKAPTKAPIALVDGSKLTELLLANQIGVSHQRVELYRLRLDDLTKDELQTVGQENL